MNAELRDLVDQMVSGRLPFPYKRDYLDPPEVYFANLRSAEYVKVSDAPFVAHLRAAARRRGKDAVRAGIAQVPWGFDRKEISLIVSEAAYDEVDVLTDSFTEEARMAARVRSFPSPLEAWRTHASASRIASKALLLTSREWFLKDRGPGNPPDVPSGKVLREACYESTPECTTFKVSLAAAIYRFFLADVPDAVVLDPFAGWGDRALGAAGAKVSYVGVDPNPALAGGYGMIRNFLAEVSPETTTRFRPIPFEDFGPAELGEDFPGGGGADLVFSSPPFYDYEIYSDDPRQSVRAGSDQTLVEWLRDWFLPATDRAWGALKPGGCLAYYLSDKKGEITTPLCDHMEAHGREFRGVIACRRGEKRPIPLWVWRKGGLEPVAVPPKASERRSSAEADLDDYVSALIDEM